MAEVVVRELWTYPVKSGQGVAAESIDVTKMGISGDRRFAIWSDGALVEQKLTPRVASIGATLDEDGAVLTLRHAKHGVHVHHVRHEGDVLNATWILDEFGTIDQGDAVAEWLSAAIDQEVRLVAPGEAWRVNFPVPQMALLHNQPKQSFTAASPVGVANWMSLVDLNTKVDTPVPMNRFRMNIVIDGLDPYEEDKIVSLSNDDVELVNVTIAERCIIVTTDQLTGERPENNLMQALAAHCKKPKEERFGSGLKFGNYMMVGKEGRVRIGDRLTVDTGD